MDTAKRMLREMLKLMGTTERLLSSENLIIRGEGRMEEGEQTVRGPGGVEVVISFLPNNEILFRVPPPFVGRIEPLVVTSPFLLVLIILTDPPKAKARRM